MIPHLNLRTKLKPEKINYRQLKWIIIIIPDYWQHLFIISRSFMIYYDLLPSQIFCCSVSYLLLSLLSHPSHLNNKFVLTFMHDACKFWLYSFNFVQTIIEKAIRDFLSAYVTSTRTTLKKTCNINSKKCKTIPKCIKTN